VFDDQFMSRFNRQLYAIPRTERIAARRTSFDAILPGVSRSQGRSLDQIIGATQAEARQRAEKVLATLAGGDNS
jgi:hypothetical protein